MPKNYKLLNDYRKFERIVTAYDGTKTIDTSKYNFLAPTTLIPLLTFINKNNIRNIKTHTKTLDYISRILNGEQTPTNTPYEILPKNRDKYKKESLGNRMSQLIDEEYAGRQTVSQIISDLTNNIYDHTPFEEYTSYGYMYAQEYPNWKKVDICVYDDGLSIPGRFDKSDIEYIDDCHAIEKALSGLSTKEKNSDERGNGLGICMKLMEANKGEALIVSREGCLEIEHNYYKYHHLNNNAFFKGTLITIRLQKNPVHFYNTIGDGYIRDTPYKYIKE